MPYKDRDKQRKFQRERNQAIRQAFFADKACVTCGSVENLELDHIDPTTKVSHAIWSWARIRRLKEIAKCQVLCKDCHAEKSAREKRVPIVHGTTRGYWNGCRCTDCKRASANYEYKRRFGPVAERLTRSS